MATWPSTLPVPNISGYKLTPEQAFSRTDMQSGAARQRKRFTDAPAYVTADWRFTPVQMAIFKTFFKTTINQGTDWFTCPLDAGIGISNYDTRFIGKPPYDAQPLPGMNWEVSAQLEVRGA